MPKGIEGKLYQCNLTKIDQFCVESKYELVFGNWALCYISDEDIERVLQSIHNILKPDGALVLKEPLILKEKDDEYICLIG